MGNSIKLTDDELTAIQTSLQLTIISYEEHLRINGDKSLDAQTVETIRDIKVLFERFNKEFF